MGPNVGLSFKDSIQLTICFHSSLTRNIINEAFTQHLLVINLFISMSYGNLQYTWSDSKVHELATVCLPRQHWTKALVWFDDVDISAFHRCVVVNNKYPVCTQHSRVLFRWEYQLVAAV